MLIRTPEQDIERVLFTEKAIAARVEQLGADLTAQLGDKRPVLVCVLKGASFFYIDLCRCMNCAIDMDFIAVSSYGASAKSTGVVRLIKDLDNNITGRHVVIVEDIIDSGLTMQYLRQLFGARNPASITTISFLDKATRHPESYKTDMCGFEIPDEFVVGYGLDYANYYRNLPYGVLSINIIPITAAGGCLRRLFSPKAPLEGELSAQLTERSSQICYKTQTANSVCGLERKKRAQRIRSLACKDSFRRGRF